MLLEASQEYQKALAFYDAELKKDEGNLVSAAASSLAGALPVKAVLMRPSCDARSS